MSNIQKYNDQCLQKANKMAQALRDLANVIGEEADHGPGRGTKAVLRLSKDAIKRKTRGLENLVWNMTLQLEAERAEFERMERLYAMARKDARDAQETIIRLMGDKEEAMLAEVELQRTINELKAKAQ